jgi:hypothetical protein
MRVRFVVSALRLSRETFTFASLKKCKIRRHVIVSVEGFSMSTIEGSSRPSELYSFS